LHVEERLEFGGDVFEECKNSVVGMLVAESVEDETVFGYERVSIRGNPFNFSRFNTPRKRIKLKIKKAMPLEKSFCLDKNVSQIKVGSGLLQLRKDLFDFYFCFFVNTK